VIRGVLERTLRLTGTVTTKNFASVSAPMMQGPDAGRDLLLVHIAAAGSMVKKNQIIAEIDGQSVQDHVDDLVDQIGQLQMEYRSLQARQYVNLESYKQRARAAKATWEKAKLDARTAPVKNKFDQELLRLSVEEAQLEYQEAERQIGLLAESQESEKLLAKYRTDFQVRHHGRHAVDLARFTVRAPMDGQVVLKSITRYGQFTQVQQGDSVSPGQPFMRVVDLSSMAVEATMSQTDCETVRVGQKAKIHFDAYPDLVLDAHVESVGTIASARRYSFYVRRIPVRIAIEGRDPRVLPDLTASADVVIGEEGDGLLIPRDAVTESGGKQMVYVRHGETITPREVEIGAVGNMQVEVVSGLQEGEQIAVQPESNSK
jgi:RND family efflux transporter MFP subunit